MKIEFLENEYWYGGIVHLGHKFPVSADDDITVGMVGGRDALDQYSPLFLSSKGRILHGEDAFDVHFNRGEILISDEYKVELRSGFGTLKGAAMQAARDYFKLTGEIPELEFFESAQCNTWIELRRNQNQSDILKYARTLKEGGIDSGILMIDGGWAPNYGIYEFSREKFDDPKAMTDELHKLGFTVMLWISPMISPDSETFRSLWHTDLLIKEQSGEPAIRRWWSGYSAVLDFSNPNAREWFKEKLRRLMDKYGVDGFKFDSGDTYLYDFDISAHKKLSAPMHTRAFNLFFEDFKFNEFRNVWNLGGAPIVCRLQDKAPRWKNDGLDILIPNMLAQGILGYYFGCPDMVGGGLDGAFTDPSYKFDGELYLRWLSASILCPMMQFSVSPKRILSDDDFKSATELLKIRREYTDEIVALAKNAALTGEPILRYMEYEFPNMGYEKITDQFMLGSNTLVAPILEKGALSRTVRIPNGSWQTRSGDMIDGGKTAKLTAEPNELIILKRVQQTIMY